VRLAHLDFGGQEPPIVILHALFASARNWVSVGRFLAEHGHTYALDLRNHGRSPRSGSHSLEDMTGDLEEWCREHLEAQPVLLGHSMGGLVAMAYALRRPEATRALIVVDIVPRAYHPSYEQEFRALRLDLSKYSSLSQIDQALKPLLPDTRVRQFFLTNIEKGTEGYYWTTNGPALEASRFLTGSDYRSLDGLFDGPVLVVAGGESAFVTVDDYPDLFRLFPRARVQIIPEADHWIHASAPAAFREMVVRFLETL
jgi:pimeloyl-ACP methyl ester carboxylesterase